MKGYFCKAEAIICCTLFWLYLEQIKLHVIGWLATKTTKNT